MKTRLDRTKLIASLAPSLVGAMAMGALAACSSDDAPADSTDSGTWGTVSCKNSSNTTDAQGNCARSYSGCSDGHSYGIECAPGGSGSNCTCRIDNVATGHALSPACGGDGLSGLAQNCNWLLH
jgi:hypothetical protein